MARFTVSPMYCSLSTVFFFFNDTATTEIYTLSLHDALPIFALYQRLTAAGKEHKRALVACARKLLVLDRKSTRLNSSHTVISYAVFCLKKKKQERKNQRCPDKHQAAVAQFPDAITTYCSP